MIAQFQLSKFQILTISVTPNDKFDRKAPSHKGDVSTQMSLAGHSEDKRRWLLDLAVVISPTSGAEVNFYPYNISITGRGFYSFKDELEEKAAHHVLRTNGAAILYGLLRAQVAQITAQSVHGQMLMPTLNFLEMEKAMTTGVAPQEPTMVKEEAPAYSAAAPANERRPKARQQARTSRSGH